MRRPRRFDAMTAFANPLAEEIWRTRYRFTPPGGAPEPSIDATWTRVARTLASVESSDRPAWERRFADVLADFRFLPGGRIVAGAGTGRRVTLFNCFVMGRIDDTLDGIFGALREGALTLQQGGGIGTTSRRCARPGEPADAARRRRVRAGVVHARLGCDVRDGPVGGSAPRRDDGHAALRSPGYRVVHRREASAGRADALQPLGARHRRAPARGRRRHRMAARVPGGRRGPAHGARGAGAGAVGKHHAHRVRVRGARRHLHRPRSRARQSRLRRAHRRDQSVRRDSAAAVRRLRSRLAQSDAIRGRIRSRPHARLDVAALVRDRAASRCACWTTSTTSPDFPLPQQAQAARASRRDRARHHGPRRCADHAGPRLRRRAARHVAADAMRTVTEAAYGASVEIAREKGAFPLYDARESTWLRRSCTRCRRSSTRRSRATAYATAT